MLLLGCCGGPPAAAVRGHSGTHVVLIADGGAWLPAPAQRPRLQPLPASPGHWHPLRSHQAVSFWYPGMGPDPKGLWDGRGLEKTVLSFSSLCHGQLQKQAGGVGYKLVTAYLSFREEGGLNCRQFLSIHSGLLCCLPSLHGFLAHLLLQVSTARETGRGVCESRRPALRGLRVGDGALTPHLVCRWSASLGSIPWRK